MLLQESGLQLPFLVKKRFMKDLEEKRVDTVLIDAVCAIAARFSTDPSLRNAGNAKSADDVVDLTYRSRYGQSFARRAMTALTETFACPTLQPSKLPYSSLMSSSALIEIVACGSILDCPSEWPKI